MGNTFLTFGKNRTSGAHSFGASGLGRLRMGPDSTLRFLRGNVADVQDDHHLGRRAQ